MSKQASELRDTVRIQVVLKYFGHLCVVLAALTMVPLVMSVISGETRLGLRYGLMIGGLAASGGCLARLRAPICVQANEGMVLVALMFLFTPLVVAYPGTGFRLTLLDATLEAVSGVKTTGLSTQATLVGAPSTFLFSRAWTQWYGGLGIVVLLLALVMEPGLLVKSLAVNGARGRRFGRRHEGPYTARSLGVRGADRDWHRRFIVAGIRTVRCGALHFAAVSTDGHPAARGDAEHHAHEQVRAEHEIVSSPICMRRPVGSLSHPTRRSKVCEAPYGVNTPWHSTVSRAYF